MSANFTPDQKEYKSYKSFGTFKLFVLENFPFIAEDFDALTYYQMLCKVVGYLKDVITNNEAIQYNQTELFDAFNELQNYVNTYFDNLDVQTEINNKLDEMSQSGQLQEIITSYLQVNGILAFNTIEELKNATNIIDGSFVKTFGKDFFNDGYGEFYKIKEIENTDIVDNVNVIPINSNPNLVAILIKNAEIEKINEKISNDWINPLNEGAKGDGITDDYEILQNCINKGNVRLSSGIYYISQPISIPSNRIFEGGNCTIIPNDNNYAISIEGNGIDNPITEVSIKNLNINTNNGGNGINIKDTYFIYIDNVNIIKLNKNNAIGFNIENGFNHVIKNSRVFGDRNYTGQIGININTTTGSIANMTNNKYDTILLQNLQYGLKANYTNTSNMINCDNLGFSNCDYCYYLDGFSLPINISNSRMESNLNNSYGFYITDNIQCTINNLNAYNIPKVIFTDSVRDLIINGSISLTGTSQDTLFKYIDNSSTGRIIDLASLYHLSNVYNVSYNNLVNRKIKFETDVTTNTINLDNRNVGIYKITSSVNILNIYAIKGSEGYIYTELSSRTILGKENSQTNKWSGAVQLTPFKLYHVLAIDNNQIIIQD